MSLGSGRRGSRSHQGFMAPSGKVVGQLLELRHFHRLSESPGVVAAQVPGVVAKCTEGRAKTILLFYPPAAWASQC